MNQGEVYANSSSLPCYYPLDSLSSQRATLSYPKERLFSNGSSLFPSRYSCIESLNRLAVCHRWCVVAARSKYVIHRKGNNPQTPRSVAVSLF